MIGTMSKKDYIYESFFWSLIVYFVFENTLLRPLFSLSLTTSRLLLWLITAAEIALDIYFSKTNNRTLTQIFLNFIFIYGTYVVVTYWNDEKTLILILLAPALLIFAFFICFVIKATSKYRVKKALFGLKQIFTLALAAIVVLIYLNSLLGNPLFSNHISPQKSVKVSDETDEWTIKNNVDTLKLFEESSWVKLNTKERTNLLQTVANIENRYLGISRPLNITIKYTVDENDYISSYLDESSLIYVNSYYLDHFTGYEMLESVLHECYHAYQYELIKVYNSAENKHLALFEDVPKYIDEFNNYKNGDGYSSQLCEKNARKYAAYGLKDYKDKIAYYSSKTN